MIRLTICAVGRLRGGPERVLTDDYLDRAGKTGRALGIGPVIMTEIDDRKGGGMAAEAALLAAALPQDAALCVLDERGKLLTSPEFAGHIATLRDQGLRVTSISGLVLEVEPVGNDDKGG